MGYARLVGLTIRGRVEEEGSLVINTFHYYCRDESADAFLTTAELGVLGEMIFSVIDQDYQGALSIHWHGEGWTAFDAGGGSGVEPYVHTFTDPFRGLRLGPMATPTICSIIRKRTGIGGKSGRGRVFLSPMSEDDLDGSKLEDWYLTEAQRLADAMVLTIEVGAKKAVPSLRSKRDAQGLPLTRCLPQSIVGHQRRRLLGRGV